MTDVRKECLRVFVAKNGLLNIINIEEFLYQKEENVKHKKDLKMSLFQNKNLPV